MELQSQILLLLSLVQEDAKPQLDTARKRAG
jgi:hypothetical protein